MLGVIGGSGFYQMEGAEIVSQTTMETPFGAPSAAVTIFSADGRQAAFLPRHGEQHQFLPSEVNYRANIWTLKKAGVKQIIAVSAVGSLREHIAPGDFSVPAQYVDCTKGARRHTFFGDGLIAHVSTAHTACPTLGAALRRAAEDLQYSMHPDTVYVCVEGPRLGTRAESFFYRNAVAADLIGMTNIPEAFLAREAQICYATLAIPTDYDCWRDDPAHHVSVEMVLARFGENIARARQIVRRIMASPPPVDETHRRALENAILTPPTMRTDAHRRLLSVLQT